MKYYIKRDFEYFKQLGLKINNFDQLYAFIQKL
jgi:hypothetical protein